ncbi:MAG: hypothetical protein KatS3mg110_0202 [Pirellulaceae bacterium]|nr:MAG: hypothetical protein KatS3mg110_0202 [Pirellulaceae bacterium]
MKHIGALPGYWVFSLGLIGFVCGCSTEPFRVPKWNWPWSRPAVIDSPYQVPTRMVVVWTPDTLTLPGRPPTRGFGGRIYFYNNQGQAIPVDGQLVVYGFDDSDPDEASTVPHRRFVFTPEQFTKHFSPSELGASYSVWIPWDTNDTRQKTISLLPVFTSVSGHRVVGEQTINVLRGRTDEAVVRREDWRRLRNPGYQSLPEAQQPDPPAPRALSSDGASHAPTPKEPARTLRTSTIPLTPALGYAIQEPSSPNSAQAAPAGPLGQTQPQLRPTSIFPANPGVPASEPAGRFPYWIDRPVREPGLEPATRFAPHQFPVPAKPNEPANPAHAPLPPSHGAPPPGLPQ